jgi:hypothetical protein
VKTHSPSATPGLRPGLRVLALLLLNAVVSWGTG